MTTIELKKFIKQCIEEQGSASSIELFRLVAELANHIPLVIHLNGESKSESTTKVSYKISDSQEEIDAIIDVALESEEADICVNFNGMTIHFSHIEVNDDILTGYIVSANGSYELYLTKEPEQSELVFIRDVNAYMAFNNDFNNDFLHKD